MKHLKLYEKYISSPVNNMYVGDYILVNTHLFIDEYEDFINSNIGKITNFRKINDVAVVEYENIPPKILDWFKKVARWRVVPKHKDETFFIYITLNNGFFRCITCVLFFLFHSFFV